MTEVKTCCTEFAEGVYDKYIAVDNKGLGFVNVEISVGVTALICLRYCYNCGKKLGEGT